eukprot:m51a1_g7899 putative dna-directed rna polymerases iv and v subunit 11-like (121) ;mRNA; f:123213-123806
MTNAPAQFEAITLPPGLAKMTYETEQKMMNAGTFMIRQEDHTLGNLLKMQLLRDPNVLFAGYRKPHPLEHYILLKVQTINGSYTPMDALATAIGCLKDELNRFESAFKGQMAAAHDSSMQ